MKNAKINGKTNNISVILGIVSAIVCILVMSIFGEPYNTLHKIDVMNFIPPIWVWKTLFSVWFFIIGYAVGKIIFDSTSKNMPLDTQLLAYRGGIFFIAAFFLSLAHYPMFFNSQKIFLSLIAVLIAAILSIICGGIWSKVCLSASLMMFSYSFWLFYVVFINGSVFFRI